MGAGGHKFLNAIGVAQFGIPHGVKWLPTVGEMDEYSENESGSTSSGSPSVNKTENVTFLLWIIRARQIPTLPFESKPLS